MNEISDDFDEEFDQNEEAYVKYDVVSYPSDYNLSTLVDQIDAETLYIPKFQRKYVWSRNQASLLIDSFLRGLPIPAVFFYINDDNTAQIIDGQRRVLSIFYFIKGKWKNEGERGALKSFRLIGLEKANPYAGKTFESLDTSDKLKLQQSTLRAINIRQLAPDDGGQAMYHIFERVNTGGTLLSSQEIRNCVFEGPLIDKLEELNQLRNWRLIFGSDEPNPRGRDTELILRLFGLSKFSEVTYASNMKHFLNDCIQVHRQGNTRGWENFVKLFEECCDTLISELDANRPFHGDRGLKISVLDAVFCNLLNEGANPPKNFKAQFDALVKDRKFNELTTSSTTSQRTISNRFEMARAMWT